MGTVKIFIKGSCESLITKIGSYEVLLYTQDNVNYFSKTNVEKTTSNKMIIQGAIDAIKRLKERSSIELYTTTAIGIGKIAYSDYSWKDYVGMSPNIELLCELRDVMSQKRHKFSDVIVDKKLIDDTFKEYFKENSTKYIPFKITEDIYNKLKEKSQKAGISADKLIENILVSWLEGTEK